MNKTMTQYSFTRIAKLAAASGLLVSLLAACAVGPDYKRPDVATPAAFKEAPVLAPGEQADVTS